MNSMNNLDLSNGDLFYSAAQMNGSDMTTTAFLDNYGTGNVDSVNFANQLDNASFMNANGQQLDNVTYTHNPQTGFVEVSSVIGDVVLNRSTGSSATMQQQQQQQLQAELDTSSVIQNTQPLNLTQMHMPQDQMTQMHLPHDQMNALTQLSAAFRYNSSSSTSNADHESIAGGIKLDESAVSMSRRSSVQTMENNGLTLSPFSPPLTISSVSPASSLTTPPETPPEHASDKSTAGSPEEKHDSQPQVCQWGSCKEEFSDASNLLNHIMDFHMRNAKHFYPTSPQQTVDQDGFVSPGSGPQSKKFICEWEGCTMILNKKDHLVSHVRIHISCKPYSCSHCSKTFKRKQDVRKHERTTHRQRTASLAVPNGFHPYAMGSYGQHMMSRTNSTPTYMITPPQYIYNPHTSIPHATMTTLKSTMSIPNTPQSSLFRATSPEQNMSPLQPYVNQQQTQNQLQQIQQLESYGYAAQNRGGQNVPASYNIQTFSLPSHQTMMPMTPISQLLFSPMV
jgi:hypothetical protein